MITFHIPQSDIAKFARWAKAAYPREALCAMIGEKEDGGMLEVKYLTKPVIGTRAGVEYTYEQWRVVREEIRSGMKFLGTIHSHPGEHEVHPSSTDIHNASANEKVYGICAVWMEEGRLRTKMEFFTGGPELEVKKMRP